MSERYRLVFRGELLEGQHSAVVKKKLGKALNLDGDRLAVLFSGKAVTLKKDADTATAARFQGLFKEAGARLRILAVSEDSQSGDGSDPAAPSSAGPVATNGAMAVSGAPSVNVNGVPELLPAGSDVLRSDERPAVAAVEIDTSHLKVQGAVFIAAEEPTSEATLDVSHLSVAEVGVDLGQLSETTSAPLDPNELDFEVAEVGSDLNQIKPEPTPPAPDTSHLSTVPADDVLADR